MSRMTKFLKQTCSFEKARRDTNDTVLLNDFGDVIYNTSITLPCRRERYVRDMRTSTGAVIKTSSRYFLDEAVEIKVDDKIDGHTVLELTEYTNQFGECEGYEVYV